MNQIQNRETALLQDGLHLRVQEVQGDHGDDQQQGGGVDQQPPTVTLQTHKVTAQQKNVIITFVDLFISISSFQSGLRFTTFYLNFCLEIVWGGEFHTVQIQFPQPQAEPSGNSASHSSGIIYYYK